MIERERMDASDNDRVTCQREEGGLREMRKRHRETGRGTETDAEISRHGHRD